MSSIDIAKAEWNKLLQHFIQQNFIDSGPVTHKPMHGLADYCKAENSQESASKTTLRAMVIKMLADNGSITNRDLVRLTNGQTWLTSDLRRDGFIKPFHADTWETGQSGKRYKRYWWTGKTLEGKK